VNSYITKDSLASGFHVSAGIPKSAAVLFVPDSYNCRQFDFIRLQDLLARVEKIKKHLDFAADSLKKKAI
jgi:hypothetical protein